VAVYSVERDIAVQADRAGEGWQPRR